MAHVVFLRAANVGGTSVFRPSEVATALKHLDIVNIGAAGTFVVRATLSPTAIRSEILRGLPFVPVMAIRPGRDVTALRRRNPFKGVVFSKDLRGWVAVMTGRPRRRPSLPQSIPPGTTWSVRFDQVRGPFALGLSRRRPGPPVNLGKSLEGALGVPVTVRWWETIEKIARILES
jgi:hypothetical protein